ncbi:hypothetical protein KO489_13340 [Reinekea forsetii]|nr:hypothetical protein [Reinekea forsetii]
MLSACGYQLRQQAVLDAGLKTIVWQAEIDADRFYPVLKQALANYQAELSNKPADVLLTLHALDVADSVLGKVRSLRATAIWSVTNAWGETIVYRHISTAIASESNVESDSALNLLQTQLFENLADSFVVQLSRITPDQLARSSESAS